MQLSLDGHFLTATPPLQALALHGYAVFTTFVAQRQADAWGVKGLDWHLQRLHRDGLALFGMAPDAAAIRAAARHFLSQCQSDLTLRITLFPRDFSIATPEVVEDLHLLVSGRTPGSSPPLRLQAIDATRIFPQYKTSNLLVNLYARREARLAGADDALLCIDQQILEGAGWNIFFSDGVSLFTPALSQLLPGVTRRLLIAAAAAAGIEVGEIDLYRDSIANYRSAFATNAAFGIVPIASLDGVGFAVDCPLLQRMQSLYAQIEAQAL